jgi:hypothetical protein
MDKAEKAYHFVMLCLWGLLTLLTYLKVFSSEVFKPSSSAWLVLVMGPIIIIVEIVWLVLRRKKEK